MSDLEELLGYRFQNPALLATALTHRSYVNEHEGVGLQHNESLEFLGDAVLGFLISSRIYRKFPQLNEGDLSKLKAYLVSAAILVDAYEAIIGAIYLDGGIEAASAFMDSQIGDLLQSGDVERPIFGDFKSSLQEKLHDRGQSEPVYKVVNEIGPDHRKVFVVQVLIGGTVISEGSGRTKKEAQQEAARLALQGLVD
jgi:ribonuclease-3